MANDLKKSACVLFLLLAFNGAAYPNLQRTFTPEQLTQDFDYLWLQLKENYAYFDKKKTDWSLVRETYRPKFAAITNEGDFIALLERVLDELYDPHTHLKVNTAQSTRLVPTGLDVWAEWQNSEAVITELRKGFSAEQAGLEVGMKIVSINGQPVEAAIRKRVGVSLSRIDDNIRSWALRALLAGTHDTKRVVQVELPDGVVKIFQLDEPAHTNADHDGGDKEVEWKLLPQRLGYIKINDLGSGSTVPQFDAALARLRNTRGLILDLRATQSGGNTSVAEPIMGRFIERRMPYQKGRPVRGQPWTKYVSPRGKWRYRAPVVVLVGRWTASMGEGVAIGFDAMKRATVVGTPMAGLNGAVFDLQLPNTKIRLNYAAEKLFHMNGTPREDFKPPVMVRLTSDSKNDLVLDEGLKILQRRIMR